MAQWWVHIEGADRDLAEVSPLMTGTSCAIARREGRYFLRSEELDGLATAEEVREAATKMLQSLNGAVRLRIRISPSFTVGNLERVDDQGSTT